MGRRRRGRPPHKVKPSVPLPGPRNMDCSELPYPDVVEVVDDPWLVVPDPTY